MASLAECSFWGVGFKNMGSLAVTGFGLWASPSATFLYHEQVHAGFLFLLSGCWFCIVSEGGACLGCDGKILLGTR